MPCASCGRQFGTGILRKHGALLVCELCRFLLDNKQCELGQKPKCWVCRESVSFGEVVIHDGRVFCSSCAARLLSLRKSTKREEIGVFSSTDELWLEVSLWRMIIESVLLAGDQDAICTQEAQSGGGPETGEGSGNLCEADRFGVGG